MNIYTLRPDTFTLNFNLLRKVQDALLTLRSAIAGMEEAPAPQSSGGGGGEGGAGGTALVDAGWQRELDAEEISSEEWLQSLKSLMGSLLGSVDERIDQHHHHQPRARHHGDHDADNHTHMVGETAAHLMDAHSRT